MARAAKPLKRPASASMARARLLPGAAQKYDASADLLTWMGEHFRLCGDIYRASIYGSKVYVTRDPVHAEHVLRANWQNYVKGRAIKRIGFLLGNGLMVSEGPFWKRQRRAIQPAFRRKALAHLAEITADANAALLKRWIRAAQTKKTVDVTSDLSQMVLNVVLTSIFGEDYDGIRPAFEILSRETARDLEFAQAFRSLGPVISAVVTRRRSRDALSMDMLGALMTAGDRESGQPMSDRQLVSEIKTLVVAGHETTAGTLNWVWYALSQGRSVEARLASELESSPANAPPALDDLAKYPYTRQIIEEALRLYPPGWLMTRRALRDDRLGPYFVPAGTEIYIPPYFIHRNPAYWDRPEEFDPDRFAPDRPQERHQAAMLAFSTGPRNCIGEFFARVEMQVHLMMTARQLRLRYPGTTPPEIDASVNLRSKKKLVMAPELKSQLLAR
ncbi:MAG TPA: cytochrome P450 [Stellaceae bacterium]|nr:cytochrome P450 [Stellaceae bacterium]